MLGDAVFDGLHSRFVVVRRASMSNQRAGISSSIVWIELLWIGIAQRLLVADHVPNTV
jgi:hypothetical protein